MIYGLTGIKLINYNVLNALLAGVQTGIYKDGKFNTSDYKQSNSNSVEDNKQAEETRQTLDGNLLDWFHLFENSSEGDNLKKDIQRIGFFKFDNSVWKNNSKDFRYDKKTHRWELSSSTLKDVINDDKYVVNDTKIKKNRLYFMAYINRIVQTTYTLTINSFYILNNNNTSTYYIKQFPNPSVISYGTGLVNWSNNMKYNIFYSYNFAASNSAFGQKLKAPVYYVSFVPHIKINSNKLNVLYPEDLTPITNMYLVNTFNTNKLIFDNVNENFYPKELTGIYRGQELINETLWSTISTSISANNYYLTDTYGYTSAKLPDPIKIENNYITGYYNFDDFNELDNDNVIGKVYFDISTKEWSNSVKLMYKPILYKTIKFAYNNLIKNSFQGLYGCPSEYLPAEISAEMLNGIGISCPTSEYLSWISGKLNIHNQEYIGNNVLKYYDNFTNIPLIQDSNISTDELLLYKNNDWENCETINTFFGIQSDIKMYDINDINDNTTRLFWKSYIPGGNNIKLFNYDYKNKTAIALGFLYNTIEQTDGGKSARFDVNPYNIYRPSGDFALAGFTPIASGYSVSIGTYPKYSRINYRTYTSGNLPPSSNSYTNESCIEITGTISGINDLLKYTTYRINFYCERLKEFVTKTTNITSTTNKIYTYADLSEITNISALASAIFQYEYGNACIDAGKSITNNNIINEYLATLDAHNWIGLETITSTITLSNLSGADYSTLTVGIATDWISGKFNINNLLNS